MRTNDILLRIPQETATTGRTREKEAKRREDGGETRGGGVGREGKALLTVVEMEMAVIVGGGRE